jgi:drug/metabolite transporter (DMT)-like permease
MDAARRGKWIGFLCLGVTAFGWALNWPLMKLLLQQWPPLFAHGLAGVAAALLLFGIAKARRQPLEVPREAIPRLLFASLTNVFAWMAFSTVAMKFVPVGEGALIVYTMPIWATLLAWPLAGIRPKLVPLIGVISAALILGEPLGLREVVAMVLTLGGVTLALQRA